MKTDLYLVIERSKRYWRGLRIARTSVKKPTIPRPSEQALVRLSIEIPDDVLNPRTVNVVINRENIETAPIKVTSQPS